jgi:hypothetical protein
VPKLLELEHLLNHGSTPQFILGLPIIKGAVGMQNQYKFIVNSSDHHPPHIHISLNNRQLASYNLETGLPVRSDNPKLDQIVNKWLENEDNRSKSLAEWERFHGGI